MNQLGRITFQARPERSRCSSAWRSGMLSSALAPMAESSSTLRTPAALAASMAGISNSC